MLKSAYADVRRLIWVKRLLSVHPMSILFSVPAMFLKLQMYLHRDKAVEIEIDYDESQFAFKDFRSSPYKAYINISIGCDKQCTFCIVPKTRGDEISIPADLIVAEARKAVENGAKRFFYSVKM
jgi:tRNA A37 methylthiotransferase MiaB